MAALSSQPSRPDNWAKQIHAVEDEREKFQGNVSSLGPQNESIHIRLNSPEMQTVPISELPHEILSQIFILSCLGDVLDLSLAPHKLPTSHTIAQVSRLWREIAKRTPQIWGHWVILDSVWTQPKMEKYFKVILDVYGRNLIRVHYRTTAGFLTPLLYVGQYKSLRILGSVDRLRDGQGPLHMPLLEELLLSDENTFHSGSSKLPIIFNTPKLKKLFIRSSANILERFTLPWSQITYFSWHTIGPLAGLAANILKVLQKLPNLAYLHLVGTFFPPNHWQEVTLSNLRTLELHDVMLNLLGQHQILRYLHLPLLERFDLVITEVGAGNMARYNHTCDQLAPFLRKLIHLQQIRIVLIARGSMNFSLNRSRHFKRLPTYKFSGKAPIFPETSEVFPPDTKLGEIWNPLRSSTFLLQPGDSVLLDRYIHQFLEREDPSVEEQQEGSLPAKHIDPYSHPRVKVLWQLLSALSVNDDLNVDFYLQIED